MCLVIRRSNYRHVSLVCEYFGEQREVKKVGDGSSKEVSASKDVSASKQVAEEDSGWTRSKKEHCTFELVGAPVKKKKYDFCVGRKWRLRVVSGTHNHKLRKESWNGHPIFGRLTEVEKLLVRELAESFMPPSQICHQLRKKFPGNCTSTRQVSNFLQRVQFDERGALTVTQWSLRFLKEHKYEVFPLRENKTNEVDVLFFAHPESLKMLRRFPYVFVIDATYKTNK